MGCFVVVVVVLLCLASILKCRMVLNTTLYFHFAPCPLEFAASSVAQSAIKKPAPSGKQPLELLPVSLLSKRWHKVH